jgi:hypothetical protein
MPASSNTPVRLIHRHSGAGRNPAATTLAQALKPLDSGLRRNDEQTHRGGMPRALLRLSRIIPDSSGLSPE